MTELAAPQISSLMEALPGIAAVLRSPVASAIASLVRAGVGLEEFSLSDAEELLRFGVRRNLLTQEEVDRLLDEAREVVARRPAKPGIVVEVGAKSPKAKSAPPAAVPETVAAAPTPALKAAKAAPPVKTAPTPVMKAHKAVAVSKVSAKAPAKAPVKAPAKAPAGGPVKSAAKAAAKPAHKTKAVAKGSKPAKKKAPHKAPVKKVASKGTAKKRR